MSRVGGGGEWRENDQSFFFFSSTSSKAPSFSPSLPSKPRPEFVASSILLTQREPR